MNAERVIDEARGFLNAIRLQCVPGSTMWINIYPMHEDFESSIAWYINEIRESFTCTGRRNVNYEELTSLINEHIFKKMGVQPGEAKINELAWHFVEYYGLASTVECEENPFNPLISETSALIELSSKEYKIAACFITEVGKNIVVTTLGHVT